MVETATKNILYIEDNGEMAEVVGELLDAEGFQFRAAGTGEEGLRLAKETQPDLILLDIILPGIDGWEVCQQLKADPDTSAIPLFFLTCRDAPVHKMVGLGILRADEYIVKPFKGDDLVNRIKRVFKDSAQ